jgi:sec-independent protein translocase protein TatC
MKKVEENSIRATNPTMSFWDHVEELRFVILRCALALLLGCAIVATSLPWISECLMWPLKRALGDSAELIQGLVTTSPMGVFSVVLQLCFLGGVALSLPLMLFFVSGFILPGLHPQERKMIIPLAFAILALFLTGGAFGYLAILPASLKVSIELNRLLGFELIWSASDYYGLVVWMTLGIGLCFEFPVVLLALMRMGVLSVQTLRLVRRQMIIVILILSALITPGGDPLSLLLLAGPLYGLYELAILLGPRKEQ